MKLAIAPPMVDEEEPDNVVPVGPRPVHGYKPCLKIRFWKSIRGGFSLREERVDENGARGTARVQRTNGMISNVLVLSMNDAFLALHL
jgi:hypothetical protein